MLIRYGNRRGTAFGNIAIGRAITNETAIIIGLFNEYEVPAIFIRTYQFCVQWKPMDAEEIYLVFEHIIILKFNLKSLVKYKIVFLFIMM